MDPYELAPAMVVWPHKGDVRLIPNGSGRLTLWPEICGVNTPVLPLANDPGFPLISNDQSFGKCLCPDVTDLRISV